MADHETRRLDAQALRSLAAAPSAGRCSCAVGACAGWESLPEERWPAARMVRAGTLRDPQTDEPTFEEFHPQGTRYGSPDAPVSLAHFPYNRCEVFSCQDCRRVLLRYTEYGGYYVDHRVRELRADGIVDAPPPSPQT